MEACVGAHHLSRKLKALGHDARLMPAKYVRPYSKGQKNDFRDGEAIGEAVQRIDQLSSEIAVLARQDAGCERLMMSAWTCRSFDGKAALKIAPPRPRIPWWKGLGAHSEEKREPATGRRRSSGGESESA